MVSFLAIHSIKLSCLSNQCWVKDSCSNYHSLFPVLLIVFLFPLLLPLSPTNSLLIIIHFLYKLSAIFSFLPTSPSLISVWFCLSSVIYSFACPSLAWCISLSLLFFHSVFPLTHSCSLPLSRRSISLPLSRHSVSLSLCVSLFSLFLSPPLSHCFFSLSVSLFSLPPSLFSLPLSFFLFLPLFLSLSFYCYLPVISLFSHFLSIFI